MRSFIFITAALTPPNGNLGYTYRRIIASTSTKRPMTFGRRPFITLLPATIQENTEHGNVDDKKKDDDVDNGADYDDDDDVDVDSVSDAEALLACRSYLQRRNRLAQWTQFEKRRVKRSNSKQSLSSTSAKSSSTQYGDKGFFWDDPSELKYLYKNKYSLPAFYSNSNNNNNASEPLVIMTGKNGVEDNEDADADADTLNLLQEDEGLLDDDDEYDDDSDDDDDMWETVRPQVSEHRSFSNTEQKRSQQRQMPTLLFWQDDEDDDVQGETSPQDFAVFDGTPSPEHVRRSRAAKRTWSDPEWRAQWQEKRWGTSRHSSMQSRNELRRRRKLEHRLRALDPDKFLPHQALAAMTENEIAHAIQEYVASNRKRGRTRAKTKAEATLSSNNKTAPTTSLKSIKDMSTTSTGYTTTTTNSPSTCKLMRQLEPDAMDLVKVQKARSERAVKAYQTRLQNQRLKLEANDEVREPPTSSSSSSSSSSIKMTVKTARFMTKRHNGVALLLPALEALLQVERDLDDGFLPNVQHVQALMEPNRLARRKDVLLRILSECFGLRGKCIPTTLPYGSAASLTSSTLTSNDGAGDHEATSVSNHDDDDDDDDEALFLFATKVPVQHLGEFIVWNLLQAAIVHELT